jgi:hypothetical protein
MSIGEKTMEVSDPVKPDNSSFLFDACVYLSGPIQYAQDYGVDWRRSFVTKVREYNLPIHIIDPCNKQDKRFDEIGVWRSRLRDMKLAGDFEGVRDAMKKIRRWDLRAVDLSDSVVFYIDPKIPTMGTIDEIVTAERQQKPVLAICNCNMSDVPDWLFTIVRHTEMFGSVDACVDYLACIDYGSFVADDRWVMIRPRA